MIGFGFHVRFRVQLRNRARVPSPLPAPKQCLDSVPASGSRTTPRFVCPCPWLGMAKAGLRRPCWPCWPWLAMAGHGRPWPAGERKPKPETWLLYCTVLFFQCSFIPQCLGSTIREPNPSIVFVAGGSTNREPNPTSVFVVRVLTNREVNPAIVYVARGN